jgi:glutamate--cysteine ligase catalytic subunit
VTCFPLLGVGDFVKNPRPFTAPYSRSEFIPDYIINPHPRFAALTTNIRSRRGSKVDIQVPLFPDVKTPEFAENGDRAAAAANLPEGYKLEPDTNIHMDAMGFGMGMCCLVSFVIHNLLLVHCS